jgi:glycosyltransferase involved in cell wall biosynthesis
MRVVYLYQYFKTRDGYGSTRAYEFASRLRHKGHEVLIITSTARIPEAAQGERRGGSFTVSIEGLDILAICSSYSSRMGFVRRVLEFLRFAIRSSLAVLRTPRPDLILASSTPLTIAIPALVGRIFRRIPLVFEVRDLWPEVPRGMGVVRSPILYSLARGLARLTYRKSRRIIALSPGMREGILRYGIPGERVVVIPNGSDLDLFRPGIDGTALRRRLGIAEGTFLIVHPGAMGIVNGLDFLLPVCRILESELPRALVYLIGDGLQRPHLQQRAEELRLVNLRFLDPVSKAEMPEWLAAADLGLMLIKRIPILEMNSANKFFDYAAAGLPCLMNYGGWKADLLRRYEAGRALETDDPEEFASAIVEFAADPDRLGAAGRGARRMAEAEFDRDRQFAEFLRVLEGAVGSPASEVKGA